MVVYLGLALLVILPLLPWFIKQTGYRKAAKATAVTTVAVPSTLLLAHWIFFDSSCDSPHGCEGKDFAFIVIDMPLAFAVFANSISCVALFNSMRKQNFAGETG